MGYIDKINSRIVRAIFEFTSGATLKSTANDTIVASSGFTATSTLTATAGAVFSSAVTCAGAVSVSSGGTFQLPTVSTTATASVGMIGFSTQAKLVWWSSASGAYIPVAS